MDIKVESENREINKKILEVKNLTASYKERGTMKQVLKDVSFYVDEGEIVGLLGDSGSGKTTLCKCILGLVKDYYGVIRHYSNNPQMIFQDPYSALNPKKTVGWILQEPLKIAKEDNKIACVEMRRKKVYDILEEVNLSSEIYNRYPRELSGGQRQRVCIALALLTDTKFILADEPLSALDVTVQAQIMDLIKRLQKERGISFLFVSHDLDVVSALCNRIIVVKDKSLLSIS